VDYIVVHMIGPFSNPQIRRYVNMSVLSLFADLK